MENNLASALTGSFVVVNLGAGGDADYNLPTSFLETMTLIEADAGGKRIDTSNKYHRKYTVRDIVAGNNIPRRFTLRKFWGCSSIYEPRQELVEQYGLEDYFEVESCQNVVPVTLSEILKKYGLNSFDYLKTDLEGVDFEVIKSCENFMNRVLGLECELRFQPFFHGEPFFYEIAKYLYQCDFELIGLKPVSWKPVTAHVKKHRDGRVTFADCFFLKKPEVVRSFESDKISLAAAKQIIIAAMSGKRSYGEWLLENYRDLLPVPWRQELAALVIPHPYCQRLDKLRRFSVDIAVKTALRARGAVQKRKDRFVFNHSYVVPGDE